MHQKIVQGKTIAAIATAMSPAGISIVRISGEGAIALIDQIYRSPQKNKKICLQKSHTVHYGYIYDGEELIDEVLVTVMKTPHSYTGEDTVEINCHGGIIVTKKILDTVIKYGAFPAEPGEFSKRAFLNGKMDLAKAEAVMDLISAGNRFAAHSAVSQLKGNLSEAIKTLRRKILDDVAFIEAALDDPEHISLEGFRETLSENVTEMISSTEKLLKISDNGKCLSEGIRTVILGKPNVGKSSILNRLSGMERAIVTEIAGTTRDLLEEQIQIGDLGFIVTDTAGIHETEDKIEKIGVNRAISAAKDGDLILYVIDAAVGPDEDDRSILEEIKEKKTVILFNKWDLISDGKKNDTEQSDYARLLQNNWNVNGIVFISAKTGDGIEKLENILTNLFLNEKIDYNNQIFITNTRQKAALLAVSESLKMVLESIKNEMPEDFYTIDLMNAYTEAGKIIGEEVEDDLVNHIFSKFCIGK